MISLPLTPPPGRPLSVLAIGAHPDDIEIGAGGLLLGLAESRAAGHVRGADRHRERQQEARAAARAFLPGADLTIDLHDLPEGRLPAVWGQVKEILEGVARSCSPDVILAPSADDAHQDHRTIGELVPTVFRDQLYLAYEIPKWDGDLSRPSMYVPLSAQTAQRKVELLHKCFPSQRGRDWWDDEVFLGLARLRGMECRAPYAEAFRCAKAVIVPAAAPARAAAEGESADEHRHRPGRAGRRSAAALYAGNLVILTRLQALTEFVDYTREELTELFKPHDPEHVHEHIEPAEMAKILGAWKPRFIHSEQSKKLVRAVIEEAGFPPEHTHYDLPKPRTSFPVGHLTTGVAFAFPWHRDVWYSAPPSRSTGGCRSSRCGRTTP